MAHDSAVGIDVSSVRMQIVIGGTHRGFSARQAAPREGADLHFGLGIERNPQRFGFAGPSSVGLVEVVEDGVGFGDFFWGAVFRTRRRQ